MKFVECLAFHKGIYFGETLIYVNGFISFSKDLDAELL